MNTHLTPQVNFITSFVALKKFNLNQHNHHFIDILSCSHVQHWYCLILSFPNWPGNVVARGTERAPDTLTVSSDSCCLAFVGPSEYIVTIADSRSLDEVSCTPSPFSSMPFVAVLGKIKIKFPFRVME